MAALVMMALGWSLNWKKSNFIPSQKVTHLGFDLDTLSMTISCAPDKVVRLQSRCSSALKSGFISAHECERVLGFRESVRPMTPYAALHYSPIQRQLLAVKSSWPRGRRYPRQLITLSQKTRACLAWWVSPSGFQGNSTAPTRELLPTVEVWTDASMHMCGAHNSRGKYFQRPWSAEELSTDPHINLLETCAAKEGLTALTVPGDRVRLHIDSTTALSYIKRQGGTRSFSLSQEAADLWEASIPRHIDILTPQWIPTKENLGADFLTRNKMDHWEVRLKQEIFCQVMQHILFFSTLDAFSLRMTALLPRYMSWCLDNLVDQDAMASPMSKA